MLCQRIPLTHRNVPQTAYGRRASFENSVYNYRQQRRLKSVRLDSFGSILDEHAERSASVTLCSERTSQDSIWLIDTHLCHPVPAGSFCLPEQCNPRAAEPSSLFSRRPPVVLELPFSVPCEWSNQRAGFPRVEVKSIREIRSDRVSSLFAETSEPCGQSSPFGWIRASEDLDEVQDAESHFPYSPDSVRDLLLF